MGQRQPRVKQSAREKKEKLTAASNIAKEAGIEVNFLFQARHWACNSPNKKGHWHEFLKFERDDCVACNELLDILGDAILKQEQDIGR